MPENIDLDKPVWTKRGGVVTGLEDCGSGFYPLGGREDYDGETVGRRWTREGFWDCKDRPMDTDLTHTPPSGVSEPAPTDSELDQLRARVAELEAREQELEHQLRQAYKANAEAWRVADKHQRVAAKGATR